MEEELPFLPAVFFFLTDGNNNHTLKWGECGGEVPTQNNPHTHTHVDTFWCDFNAAGQPGEPLSVLYLPLGGGEGNDASLRTPIKQKMRASSVSSSEDFFCFSLGRVVALRRFLAAFRICAEGSASDCVCAQWGVGGLVMMARAPRARMISFPVGNFPLSTLFFSTSCCYLSLALSLSVMLFSSVARPCAVNKSTGKKSEHTHTHGANKISLLGVVVPVIDKVKGNSL